MNETESVRRVRIDLAEVAGLGVEPIEIVIRSRLRRADFDLKRNFERFRCTDLGPDVWEYVQPVSEGR